ncbi:MAG TPA: hypothetical protein GX701_03665 [Clostridiales bacterium]|jgi:stage III sporulation protein AG|nr:hypothetical protein [Clostridiales bacterium]
MRKLPDQKQLLALLKKNKWILILLAAGLLLILWPVRPPAPQAEGPLSPETGEYAFDLAAYEARLTEILSSVQGAGRVRVMLYLKSGTETVYAEEARIQRQDTLVESEERSLVQMGQNPIVVKRLYPSFGGAVIVCEGAGNSLVELEITKAVSALTGLSTDKIAVLPMKTP